METAENPDSVACVKCSNPVCIVTELQPNQPVEMLAQIMVELAMMHWEKVVDTQKQLEVLHNKSECQTKVLGSWVAQAGSLPPRLLPLALAVALYADADDLKAFLEVFEVTLDACRWPAEECALLLLPLLSGKGQVTSSCFNDVCHVILDQLGLTFVSSIITISTAHI